MARQTTRLVRNSYRQKSIGDLPFVGDVKDGPRRKRRSFWNVPQTEDYGAACNAGRRFAGDFVQYLRDRPETVGSNTIGLLVRDMAAQWETGAYGFEVEFWAMLEILLYRAATRENHWDVLQMAQDRYDQAAMRAEQEREEAA